jgi:hypothetical protein
LASVMLCFTHDERSSEFQNMECPILAAAYHGPPAPHH